jgi:ribosomal protein L11 methyltransferase
MDWPVRAGRKTVVVPPFGEYLPKEDEITIQIASGSAFGTGSHPTTALCIRMLERYLKQGDLLLDVGTGTGILMVAAAKLGAKRVQGVDKNPESVTIARKNLMENRIGEERFDVRVGDLLTGVDIQFDVVVANLLTEIIVVLLDDLNKVLKPGGVFICSGMIERNTHRVVEKMGRLGLKLLDERTKTMWVAMAATRCGEPL